jgi:hypothetical protein
MAEDAKKSTKPGKSATPKSATRASFEDRRRRREGR